MKKRCSICKKQLDTDQFYRCSSRKDGLATACKKCVRKSGRKHYENNKEYYIQKSDRRKKEIQELIQEKKECPCTDCKKRFPFYVMDFDHREGEEKDFIVSRGWLTGSKKRVLDEIAKCDVVCANCHRIRTYRRNHST